MEKSPEAFRTISEVADLLETPAHVLRFWESRFPQIRPVKRAGGRRYYRPGDVALLSGIKRLLHDDGMTIRGVQKILREHGVKHVAGLSGTDIADPAHDDVEAALAAEFGPEPAEDEVPPPPTAGPTAQIISLERAISRSEPPVNGQEDSGLPVSGDVVEAEVEQAAEAPFVDVDEPATADVLRFAETATEEAPATDTVPEIPAEEADGRTDAIDDIPLAGLLRRLPPGALAEHREALGALRGRMVDLRDRLAAASRRRVR
jgi:DNA-binding transcriptional MerR regulator